MISSATASATTHPTMEPAAAADVLPSGELTAVLISGATCRITGFQGRHSPDARCLEVLPYATKATWWFCDAAERALNRWGVEMDQVVVAERRRHLAQLRRDMLPRELPHHAVGLTDGTRFAAYADGTLIHRAADGQQVDRQCVDAAAASAHISEAMHSMLSAQVT